ncbi:MAG: hypothetical protein V8T45_10940 [Oscillospiraceae bacterium]
MMQATTKGTLKDCPVEFSNKSACCVILASQGYPQEYQTGCRQINNRAGSPAPRLDGRGQAGQ